MHVTRRTVAGLLLLTGCAALGALAVARRAEAGDSPPSILYPGDARVCGRCIAPGTDTMLVMMQDEQDRVSVVARTVHTTGLDPRDPSRLVRVERSERNANTVVLRHATLAPVRSHATMNRVRSRLAFSGTRVRGTIETGARDLPVRVSLPHEAFLENAVELVAGAVAGNHALSLEAAFVDPATRAAPEYQRMTVMGRRTGVLRSGETCSGPVVRVHSRDAYRDLWIEERTRRLISFETPVPGYPRRAWVEASRCPTATPAPDGDAARARSTPRSP